MKPRHPSVIAASQAAPRPPALPPGYAVKAVKVAAVSAVVAEPEKPVDPTPSGPDFWPEGRLFTIPFGGDCSINARPPASILFAGKPTQAMEKRWRKNAYARKLELQRRFREAEAVQAEEVQAEEVQAEEVQAEED